MLSWIPKSKAPFVPATIVEEVAPVIVEESVAPETPNYVNTEVSAEDDILYWDSDERTWIHIDTEMRYDPVLDNYHMFVGEEGESRRLTYHVEGEGLTLTTTGAEGQSNWQLFMTLHGTGSIYILHSRGRLILDLQPIFHMFFIF